MYAVLAFYKVVKIDEPKREVKRWKKFLETLDASARIYLADDGVNSQMSLHENDLKTFLEWLRGDERYSDIDVKIHMHLEHAFPKLTVKYREQLCALDKEVDFSKQATHLPAKEWTKMVREADENTVVLDVRNDYEWEVGHFKGAERPDMQTFREFPEFLERLKERLDPTKTKVMMYCTGGIRCEFFSPLMKEAGFEDVYQLNGGIIKYGLEEGQGEWKGDLFVFDDRLVVPISNEEHEVISVCHTCGTSSKTYYNCANMDCNELFLSCLECASKVKGCCSSNCLETGRCREFAPVENPKPFRKLNKN